MCYQTLIIQYLVDANKKCVEETKKTLNKHESEFIEIKTIIEQMLVQNQHSSPSKMESLKSQDTDTLVPDKRKATPL